MPTIEQELERVKRIAQMQKPESFTDVMQKAMDGKFKPVFPVVAQDYTLPFDAYGFQADAVDWAAQFDKVGLIADVGLGKTYMATALALYKFVTSVASKGIVVCPPILLDQWSRFLLRVPGVTVQIYRGTPAKRKKIHLGDAHFTIVGSQIFKKDFDRFEKVFGHDTVAIRDEAHDIKNVSSDNYRKWSQFTLDKQAVLLTGTPMTSPEDGYAYVKLATPSVYKTKAQFMHIHVAEVDFFQKPVKWRHLDKLRENLELRYRFIRKEDVLKDLPEMTWDPIHYELNPEHMALYKELAEQQLLLLEGGGKIDATSTGKLFHCLSQIICNYDYFSGDVNGRSTCYDLIDQVMDELGPKGKLVIYAVYRMTNTRLLGYLKKFDAVAVYGKQTAAQNRAAVDYFISNPACQVIMLQPSSGGAGVDGLQDVCQDGLILEPPTLREFIQSTGRLHRNGQLHNVHMRLAVADNTLQVGRVEHLLNNDDLLNQVFPTVQSLREAIYGKSSV